MRRSDPPVFYPVGTPKGRLNHVTLKRRLAVLAPGRTPRSALEKFSAVQTIDALVPTTDGRELQLTRTARPEPDLKLLLAKLKQRHMPGDGSDIVRRTTRLRKPARRGRSESTAGSRPASAARD